MHGVFVTCLISVYGFDCCIISVTMMWFQLLLCILLCDLLDCSVISVISRTSRPRTLLCLWSTCLQISMWTVRPGCQGTPSTRSRPGRKDSLGEVSQCPVSTVNL
jgi:hypothetical protein